MRVNNQRDAGNPVINENDNVKVLVMKLAQSESKIRAILNNEVDAVLDPTSLKPIIFNEAQERLRRREEQLTRAELLAQLGSWTWDISTDLITWSEGLFGIHGFPYQEDPIDLITFLNHVHPEDRELVYRTFEYAAQNKKPFSLRYRIIRQDLKERTLLTRASIFSNQKGTKTKMIGVCLDISESIKTEAEMAALLEELRATEKKLRTQNEVLELAREQLLQERQRYHDLFEFAPDGYLVTDLNGKILEANQAAAGLFETKQDLLSGKFLAEFISPEELRNFNSMMNQIKVNGKVSGWESTLKLQDGAPVPVVMIVASQRDLGGRPLSLRWQLHDITERKLAAESLRTSQQKLQSIVTGAPLLLWAVDRQKTITYLEGKSLSTMSLNGGNFIGKTVSDLFDDSPQVLNHIDSALNGEEVVGILNAQGRVLETRYSPLRDSKKEVTGVIGVSIDITAQKQLEADLAELNKRLVQGRENDRLQLSRKIHDGPVQDMYGILFHLRAFTDSLPEGINQTPVKVMQESLQQVIDTLRTISGELRPPTLAPFGLEKAIRSHAALIQEANPQLLMELNLMSDGQELPELVRLALFRIYQQALTNVIQHAHAKNVLVQLEITDDQITLAVQDDGVGFNLPEKWIHFARSSKLGLIDAIERAQSAGGHLFIETAPGKGTILRTIIPH